MLRDLCFAIAVLALAVTFQLARPILIVGDVYDPEGRPIAGVLGTSNYRAGAKDRAEKRGATSFIAGCPAVRKRASASIGAGI